eukprot:gene34464-44531_t
MNVTNHFELLGALLLRDTAVLVSKNLRTTVRLKDFATEEGIFQKDLFNFLCWLVSDNERECYISQRCNIKFIHFQANNELLKITIGATSRCALHLQVASEGWVKKVSLSWMKHSGTVPAAAKKDTAKETSISSAAHSAAATHSVPRPSSSLSRTSSSISASSSEEGGAAGDHRKVGGAAGDHRKVGGTDKGQWRSHLADMDRMDRMIERLKKSVGSSVPLHPVPVRIPVLSSAAPPVLPLREEAPASEFPRPHGDEEIGPGLEQAEIDEGEGDGDGDDVSSVGTGCNAVHPAQSALELDQGDSAEALAACDSSSSSSSSSSCSSDDNDDNDEKEEQVPPASASAAFISLSTLRSLLRQMRDEGSMPAAANLAEPADEGPRATLGGDSVAPLPVGPTDLPVDTSSALAMLRSLLQQAKATRCLIHRSRDLLLASSSSSYPSPPSPAALSPEGR